MLEAYNSNLHSYAVFGFTGGQPDKYGPGLPYYLNSWTGRNYGFAEHGAIIEEQPPW